MAIKMVGIDPGEELGLALVEIPPSPSTPRLLAACTLTFPEFHAWLLETVAGGLVAGWPFLKVAVEGWEWQGSERSRGVPHAAERYGRVRGALEARGCPVVTVTRSDVFRHLRMGRHPSKEMVYQWVTALVGESHLLPPPPKGYHAADAVAAALAGASRPPHED